VPEPCTFPGFRSPPDAVCTCACPVVCVTTRRVGTRHLVSCHDVAAVSRAPTPAETGVDPVSTFITSNNNPLFQHDNTLSHSLSDQLIQEDQLLRWPSHCNISLFTICTMYTCHVLLINFTTTVPSDYLPLPMTLKPTQHTDTDLC